jgi:hypothetical protein
LPTTVASSSSTNCNYGNSVGSSAVSRAVGSSRMSRGQMRAFSTGSRPAPVAPRRNAR